MRRFAKFVSALSMTLSLNACWFLFPSTDETTATFNKQLRDSDGDGFMTSPECDQSAPQPFCFAGPLYEDPGCIVSPNPGGCAVIEWSQTITDDGVSTLYTTCETCIDADGNQVGDTRCEEEQPAPPSTCWTVDDSCWECTTPEGDGYSACVDPTVYCESNEDCSEGESCIFYPEAECPPNALCAPSIAGGVCGVVDPNIYCNTNEECPDGTVCTPNENPPCTEEPCFFYEPYYAGICTEAPTAGCDQYTDAESCTANGCGWTEVDTLPACGGKLGEDCITGYCSEPTPEDPCVSHTDQDSCNSDPSMFCAWMEDPTIVCVTEPCDQHSCQFVGCGDVAP